MIDRDKFDDLPDISSGNLSNDIELEYVDPNISTPVSKSCHKTYLTLKSVSDLVGDGENKTSQTGNDGERNNRNRL